MSSVTSLKCVLNKFCSCYGLCKWERKPQPWQLPVCYPSVSQVYSLVPLLTLSLPWCTTGSFFPILTLFSGQKSLCHFGFNTGNWWYLVSLGQNNRMIRFKKWLVMLRFKQDVKSGFLSGLFVRPFIQPVIEKWLYICTTSFSYSECKPPLILSRIPGYVPFMAILSPSFLRVGLKYVQ